MAEENEEIEVIDVELTEQEIDEMIAHLIELKEHKTNVQFPIAADVDLSVTYDNNEQHPAVEVVNDGQHLEEIHLDEHHEEVQEQMGENK